MAPRLLLVVLALLVAAVLAAATLAVLDARRPEPRVAAASGPVPARTEAIAVLAAWDRRRAEAWAGGDLQALAGLYAPGSRAGREDVAMLRRWTARGLRVSGLRMQVREVTAHDLAGERWELEVTDRLAGGLAVGRGIRAALPRDGWSTRRIVLERVAGQWRVASVRSLPSRPPERRSAPRRRRGAGRRSRRSPAPPAGR